MHFEIMIEGQDFFALITVAVNFWLEHLQEIARSFRPRDFTDPICLVLADSDEKFRQNVIQDPKTIHKKPVETPYEHPNTRKHQKITNQAKLIDFGSKSYKFLS